MNLQVSLLLLLSNKPPDKNEAYKTYKSSIGRPKT